MVHSVKCCFVDWILLLYCGCILLLTYYLVSCSAVFVDGCSSSIYRIIFDSSIRLAHTALILSLLFLFCDKTLALVNASWWLFDNVFDVSVSEIWYWAVMWSIGIEIWSIWLLSFCVGLLFQHRILLFCVSIILDHFIILLCWPYFVSAYILAFGWRITGSLPLFMLLGLYPHPPFSLQSHVRHGWWL